AEWLDELARVPAAGVERALEQDVRVADHHVDRGAELVRHPGHEIALVTVRLDERRAVAELPPSEMLANDGADGGDRPGRGEEKEIAHERPQVVDPLGTERTDDVAPDEHRAGEERDERRPGHE